MLIDGNDEEKKLFRAIERDQPQLKVQQRVRDLKVKKVPDNTMLSSFTLKESPIDLLSLDIFVG